MIVAVVSIVGHAMVARLSGHGESVWTPFTLGKKPGIKKFTLTYDLRCRTDVV